MLIRLVDMLSVNLDTPAEISFYCYGVSYNDFLTCITAICMLYVYWVLTGQPILMANGGLHEGP